MYTLPPVLHKTAPHRPIKAHDLTTDEESTRPSQIIVDGSVVVTLQYVGMSRILHYPRGYIGGG